MNNDAMERERKGRSVVTSVVTTMSGDSVKRS
jgi:hypothetical protein